MHLQPSSSINRCCSADPNWCPWSVVMEDGTPNLNIQQLIKVWATVSAVMSTIGMASGHLVILSIQSVNELSSRRLKGPTILMCILANLHVHAYLMI